MTNMYVYETYIYLYETYIYMRQKLIFEQAISRKAFASAISWLCTKGQIESVYCTTISWCERFSKNGRHTFAFILNQWNSVKSTLVKNRQQDKYFSFYYDVKKSVLTPHLMSANWKKSNKLSLFWQGCTDEVYTHTDVVKRNKSAPKCINPTVSWQT